ncbi:MAG: hypothetical protein ACE364_03500 [Chlorobiota bacterium]
MIEILIFELHLLASIYVFTKGWQGGSIKDGLMAVAILLLFFTIGWAITGTIANLLYPSGWNTIYFTQDTFSLVLLLIPELLFFKFYFLSDN